MAPNISKVDTDRHGNPRLSAWDFRDEVLRWLLHGIKSPPSGEPAHPISRESFRMVVTSEVIKVAL
jgi:hypothetical protein